MPVGPIDAVAGDEIQPIPEPRREGDSLAFPSGHAAGIDRLAEAA